VNYTSFRISHNSFHNIGFPWVQSIIKGLTIIPPCPTCGCGGTEPKSTIEVELDQKKGTKWPDALGCGAEPLFIVSERTIAAWIEVQLIEPHCHPIVITGNLPKRLESSPAPKYFWFDGSVMKGAELDFVASGFIGVSFCPTCGRRSEDVSATHIKQHSAVWPFVFKEKSWNGSNLFTTDLSPAAFFCTEKIYSVVSKFKFTNFWFMPIEKGSGFGMKGLKY